MATLREKRPGEWEVRVFTASDARGRPTQLSRTVHRAALSQAERWGWVSNNVAGVARLKSSKTQQRSVMSLDDVRAVMAAAATIDPAALLALRVAAVAGARRAELAALQWTDVVDGQLTIDSAIEFVTRGDGSPEMRDAATKTANTRTLTLDPDTLALIEAVRIRRQPSSCSSTGRGGTSRCSGSPTGWPGAWALGLAGPISLARA